MTQRTLHLRAGQTGRLHISLTAPSGTDTTLTGAVCVQGIHHAMQRVGSNLLMGSMPPGMWLYEVRAGGATILYGHVEVAPSPLADATGEVGWQVDADLTADVATIEVTLSEGLRGESGATPTIGANSNWWIDGEDTGSPSVIDPIPIVEEAVDHALMVTRDISHSTPTGTDNALCHWIEIAAARAPAGKINAISIMCRSTEVSTMTTAARYLGVWEDDGAGGWTRIGASTNAVSQAVGRASSWVLDGLAVSGRALRLTLLTSRTSDWQTSSVIGLRVAPAADGSSVIYNGTHLTYLPEMRIDVTEHRPLYAPAEHVEDAIAHATAEDRYRWDTAAAGGITRAEMEAYVMDYVAAHVPDLSNYQGAINLRDEAGNNVLRADTDSIDGSRHCYLGDTVDVSQTQVTISAWLDVTTYPVISSRYIVGDKSSSASISLVDNYYLRISAPQLRLRASSAGSSSSIVLDGYSMYAITSNLYLQRDDDNNGWPAGSLWIDDNGTGTVISRPDQTT